MTHNLVRNIISNVASSYQVNLRQGAHPSGKSQGNLVFLQGQGKVREFCKMVREISRHVKFLKKKCGTTRGKSVIFLKIR